MDREKLAKFMHDEYEYKANQVGWRTQLNCKVGWDNLPEDNKLVMLYVAQKILDKLVKGVD